MARFILESLPEETPAAPSAAAPRRFVLESLPDQSPEATAGQVGQEILTGIPRGFNEGFDNLYNLPNKALNWATSAVGIGPVANEVKIASRFNEGVPPPQTTAGRIVHSAGEALGSSVVPMGALYGQAGKLAASGATKAVPTMLESAAQPIAANMKQAAALDVAAAAGSGAGSQLAEEAGGGPTAQAIGGLLGGLAPLAVHGYQNLNPVYKTDFPQPVRDLPPAKPAVPEPAVAPSPKAAAPAAPAPEGVSRIVTPDGSMEIEARPQIVELSDLRLAQGDYQPRDRDRIEYVQEARDRAVRLDPEQLKTSRVSDSGAPIVLEDGTILSGNGRSLSISEVYRNPNLKQQADAYRAAIGAPEGMKEPVLVMRTSLPAEDATRFADLSNRSRVAQMSATERAQRDAKAMGDIADLYRGGDVTSPENAAFAQAFVNRAVAPSERASISRDNQLTKEGAERMRAALLASAYDDAPTLARMLESTDDNIRNVTGALAESAPRVIALRKSIEAGQATPALDPTKNLTDAVRFLAELRSKGLTPADHFAQGDMFGQPLYPGTELWLRGLYADDLTTPLSKAQMRKLLDAYSDEAAKHAPGGLIPDMTTQADVMRVARRAALAEPAAPNGVAPASAQLDQTGMPGPAPGTLPGPAPASGGGMNPPQRVELPPEFQRTQRPSVSFEPRVSEERQILDPTREELLGAGGRLGVDIPRAVAAEPMAQSFAAGLGSVYFGSPIRQSVRRLMGDVENRTNAVADSYGKGGYLSAGESTKDALVSWIRGESADVTERLFSGVKRYLEKGAMAPLVNTREAVRRLNVEMANSASKVNQRAVDLVDEAIRRDGMNYDGLRQLRTHIGQLLDGSIIPEPGTPRPALKQIYASLTEDLRSLVYQAGGKPGLKAFERAENANVLAAQKRDRLASIVGKDGDKSPEAVLGKIVNMAKEGATGDVTTLMVARKAAGAEAWNEIAAQAILKMGRNPKTNEFSPARFLTDYGKFSNNGKSILFGSTGKDSLKAQLDDIATVAKRVGDLESLANSSKTGNTMAVLDTASSIGLATFVHPLSVLFTALPKGGGFMLARYFAQPAKIKQMTRWMNAVEAVQKRPTQATRALYASTTNALANSIAGDTGQDRNDVVATLGTVLNAMAPKTPGEAAEMAAYATPVLGEALSAKDSVMAASQGDWAGAALSALGVVPFVGAVTKPASKAATKVAAKEAADVGASEGFRVYHGSPHDWAAERLVRYPDGRAEYIVGAPGRLPDVPAGAQVLKDFPDGRVRNDKINTGEGSQAFSHGFYSAEDANVAKSYRDQLAAMHAPVPDMIETRAASYLKGLKNDRTAAASALDASRADALAAGNKQLADEYGRSAELIRSGWSPSQVAPEGRMYELNVKASPEHFLDWDKPLREQSEAVRSALSKIEPANEMAARRLSRITDESTGEQVVSAAGKGAEGSKTLAQAGIPGVRYLDGNSRNAGEGSRNYVIYNEELVSVVRKYGLPVALALGLLTPEQGEAMQRDGVLQ